MNIFINIVTTVKTEFDIALQNSLKKSMAMLAWQRTTFGEVKRPVRVPLNHATAKPAAVEEKPVKVTPIEYRVKLNHATAKPAAVEEDFKPVKVTPIEYVNTPVRVKLNHATAKTTAKKEKVVIVKAAEEDKGAIETTEITAVIKATQERVANKVAETEKVDKDVKTTKAAYDRAASTHRLNLTVESKTEYVANLNANIKNNEEDNSNQPSAPGQPFEMVTEKKWSKTVYKEFLSFLFTFSLLLFLLITTSSFTTFLFFLLLLLTEEKAESAMKEKSPSSDTLAVENPEINKHNANKHITPRKSAVIPSNRKCLTKPGGDRVLFPSLPQAFECLKGPGNVWTVLQPRRCWMVAWQQ